MGLKCDAHITGLSPDGPAGNASGVVEPLHNDVDTQVLYGGFSNLTSHARSDTQTLNAGEIIEPPTAGI